MTARPFDDQALTRAEQAKQSPAETRPPTTVHFMGGPWNGQTYDTERITAPVFAVGHEVGNHYWLDTKSDPPTYFWEGSA